MRGVKPLFTSARSLVCFGGSMLSIINCMRSRSSGTGSKVNTPFFAEEKVRGSRDTATTSRYFVTAQNPGPLASLCQNTGAC